LSRNLKIKLFYLNDSTWVSGNSILTYSFKMSKDCSCTAGIVEFINLAGILVQMSSNRLFFHIFKEKYLSSYFFKHLGNYLWIFFVFLNEFVNADTLSNWLSCLEYIFFCKKCSCGWQWMQEVKKIRSQKWNRLSCFLYIFVFLDEIM